MRVLSRLLSPIDASTPGPLDDHWYTQLGLVSAAGIRVDEHTALKLSTVWRCVELIAGSVGSLPLLMYERTAGGKRRAEEHPLFDVLHDQPNPRMTSDEWREMSMLHLLFRGNAYAQILPGPRGAVDRLEPIHPDMVTPELQVDGSIHYQVQQKDGTRKRLYDYEMLHIRGMSRDGVVGIPQLEYAANTIGLASAQDRFASNFFNQAPAPGGMLKHPGKLGDDAQKRLKKQVREKVGGPNQQTLLVLEEGMEYQQLQVGLTAEQAQLVAARETTAEDVCRWMGVPPHMVGLTSKSTSWGTGIEQMSIGFVVFTLMRWIRRWEAGIKRDLIIAPRKYFASFLVDGLLRGDAKSRAETLQIWRRNGIINADEWRELENMNLIADGSGRTYIVEGNMVPLDKVGQATASTAPAPRPAVDDDGEDDADA